jgi:hypothetical protein
LTEPIKSIDSLIKSTIYSFILPRDFTVSPAKPGFVDLYQPKNEVQQYESYQPIKEPLQPIEEASELVEVDLDLDETIEPYVQSISTPPSCKPYSLRLWQILLILTIVGLILLGCFFKVLF